MTPQEEAKRLVDLYQYNTDTKGLFRKAKRIAIKDALICVDEMLKNADWLNHDTAQYWEEVKEALNK